MIARILIADDHPEIRLLLREFLENRRHQVLEASDGAQAFMLAEKEMPHLIISDIVMGGVYGTTAARRLQDYWRTAEIPIILISGTVDAHLVGELLENPKIRFLQKPLDMARLERTIAELLPGGGYTA